MITNLLISLTVLYTIAKYYIFLDILDGSNYFNK